MIGIHIPIMFVISLGVLPIMRTGMKIVRLEGVLLLAFYIAYSVMLFQTTGSEGPVVPVVTPPAIEAPAHGKGQSSKPAITNPDAAEVTGSHSSEISAPVALPNALASTTTDVLLPTEQAPVDYMAPVSQNSESATATVTP